MRRISLEVEPFIDVVLPIVNTTGATGLNWDGQTDRLYWTDIIDNTINVANINVSRLECPQSMYCIQWNLSTLCNKDTLLCPKCAFLIEIYP